MLHQEPVCGHSLEQGRWDPCPHESYSLVGRTVVKEVDNYIKAQVLQIVGSTMKEINRIIWCEGHVGRPVWMGNQKRCLWRGDIWVET